MTFNQIDWRRIIAAETRIITAHVPRGLADKVEAMAARLDRSRGCLGDFPRLGERLDAYAPREVRRIIVGNYELRYEIVGAEIFILRLWHNRANRAFGPDD